MAARRSDEALKDLTFVCEPEIEEAINAFEEDGGRLFLDTTHYTGAMGAIVRKGVLYAAQSLRNEPGRDLLEYVRASVEKVLWEIVAERKAKLERHTPEALLGFLSVVPREVAVSQFGLLGPEKRLDLLELIAQRLMQRSGQERLEIWFTPEHEPEDGLLFLAWYLLMIDASEPSVQDALARGQLKTVVRARGLSPPKNRRGEPVNPLGPILVKVYDVLTGLPNNEIPAPARSDTKLGISFNVDRAVIKRWKSHPEWEDLQVDTKPDGKGGVHYAFNLEALLRSVRIVQGQKRGRPPQDRH